MHPGDTARQNTAQSTQDGSSHPTGSIPSIILDSISDAVIFTDLNFIVLNWNRAAEHIYGWNASEVTGKSLTGMLHTTFRDGITREDAFADLTKTGKWTGEVEQISKDGTKLHIFSSVVIVHDERGSQIGIVAVNRDITGQKKAEADLQQTSAIHKALMEKLELQAALVENITDAIISTDLEGKILSWNPAATSMYNISEEEAIGKKVTDFLEREDVGTTQATPIDSLMREGSWRGEMTQHTSDGKTLYVLSSKSLMSDSNGVVTGIVTINRDITLRKKAEDEVRRLNEELEQSVQNRTAQLLAANKELEAFSYSVSHDLRAPLRAVDGYARILIEEHMRDAADDARKVAEEVRAGAQRMGKLIDDLLAFSRAGRTALKSHSIDMTTLAQSVFFELTTPERRIIVDFVISDMPVAQGDPSMMRLVWTNLLSNALKFSAKVSNPRIEVGGRTQGNETIFFVRDNGAGFDMQYYDKLFGVFQRLHSAHEFSGTGVGLAIIQRIIHRHGGRVFAEGKVDEGATFSFTIPV